MKEFKPVVLFTETDSVYNQLNCDTYDLSRSAYSYTGSTPVICHPPCRLFSRLRYFSTAPSCEMLTAFFAIVLVRSIGGIIEHPEGSLLFNSGLLPCPGQSDFYGGYTIKVNQKDFGHPCRKTTYLYINGIPKKLLPAEYLSFTPHAYKISNCTARRTKKPTIPRADRSKTPIQFAKYLIDICKHINDYKNGITIPYSL